MKGEYQTTTPTVLTEQRRPATEPRASHIGVVFLAAFGSFAVLLFGGLIITLLSGVDDWFIGGIVIGLAMMTGVWFYGLLAYQNRILWRAERILGYDIDQDGEIGEPPIDNYFPVFTHRRTPAVDIPEPPPRAEGDKLIRLRPTERTIEKWKVWEYLLAAFESGDWTRDGATRLASPINQKEWADVKRFVQRWPGVWGTDQRPALEAYLRSLGWTGPNGTERTEPNGG